MLMSDELKSRGANEVFGAEPHDAKEHRVRGRGSGAHKTRIHEMLPMLTGNGETPFLAPNTRLLFVTSRPRYTLSVSQGRISSDNCTCCHTKSRSCRSGFLSHPATVS